VKPPTRERTCLALAAGFAALISTLADANTALAQGKIFSREGGRLQGVHGFVGLGAGFGPTLHTYEEADGDLEGPDTYGASLFALQGGAFLNRLELMIEWAPGTFRPLSKDEPPHIDAGDSFYSLVGSVGYYIPVTDVVYWPLRLGAGVGSDRNDMIARLDLLNVAVKTKHVIATISLPSIRYMSDFDEYHRWTGLFELSAAYIFP
jgi:hypothetical protein